MNKIRTSISEMYVDEEGILHVEIFENAHVTLEKIKENYAAYKTLLGDRKALLLIDGRKKYTFSREAREYAAGEDVALNRVATAMIASSFGGWLMAAFYIRFNRPAIPTRVFASREKALQWLRSFYVFPGDKRPGKRKK